MLREERQLAEAPEYPWDLVSALGRKKEANRLRWERIRFHERQRRVFAQLAEEHDRYANRLMEANA